MMKLKRLYTGLTAVFFLSVNSLAQSPQQMDLGLSVDWAASNLGAVSPEEFGGYYGWADPTGNETTADVLDNTRNWISDLYGGAEPPAEISGTTLDIARTVLGDGWRLPTLEEMKELTDCRHQWTRINGVNGYEITGKNGVKIFLPAGGARNDENIRYAGAVGYYWTGTLGTEPSFHKQRAHRLYIGAEGFNHNPAIRCSGFPIRPVRDKNLSGITYAAGEAQTDARRIYDMTGRSLKSEPGKGIYIKDGKKYVVR